MEKQRSSPLLCFLCNGKFKRPKILNCLHSYCENCLQEVHEFKKPSGKDNNIRCPICRQTTPVQNGVRGAKTNIFLVRLVEEATVSEVLGSKTARLCNVCNKHEAVSRCFDCALFLGVVCRAIHGRLPASRGHAVYTLDECRAGKAAGVSGRCGRGAPECPDHTGERCRFYCLTCQKLTCRDCAMLDSCSSKSHEYTSFETAASSERHATDALMASLENKLPDLETSLQVLDAMGLALKKHSDTAKAKVQAAANKMREGLAEQEKLLLKEIRLESQKQLKVVNENQKEVSATLDSARFSLQSARLFAQRSTDSEFLWLYSTLMKNLEDLVLKEPPGKPSALKFTECDDDISLGTLMKENITEAVELALQKTKAKEQSTSRKAAEKTFFSPTKAYSESYNKGNPPSESEDCSDSEDENSGSSSPSTSDELRIPAKQPVPTGKEKPTSRKVAEKTSFSRPKAHSASSNKENPQDERLSSSSFSASDKPRIPNKQPVPNGQDTPRPADRKGIGRQSTVAPAIPPSDRVLRSTSKANTTQSQASSRPAARQQARVGVASTELGLLAEKAADSPDCGQASSRINPRAARSAQNTSSVTQLRETTTRLTQQEHPNFTQASTVYTSAPPNDYNSNPNFAAAAGVLASMQQANYEEPPHSDRKPEGATGHQSHHLDYPLITTPNSHHGDVQGSANKYDTDSDDSDL